MFIYYINHAILVSLSSGLIKPPLHRSDLEYLPWLPQFEGTVTPCRRKDYDPRPAYARTARPRKYRLHEELFVHGRKLKPILYESLSGLVVAVLFR